MPLNSSAQEAGDGVKQVDTDLLASLPRDGLLRINDGLCFVNVTEVGRKGLWSVAVTPDDALRRDLDKFNFSLLVDAITGEVRSGLSAEEFSNFDYLLNSFEQVN